MAASSGFAMEVHFCMGEKTGTDLYVGADTKCGRCGMPEKKGGCCNDEIHFYKFSADYKHVGQQVFPEQNVVLLKTEFSLIDFSLSDKSDPDNSYSSSPPGEGLPLFIKNRVFRI
jgi:hypothetical protein